MLPVLGAVAAHGLLRAHATSASAHASVASLPRAPTDAPSPYVFNNPYANARAPSADEVAVIKSTVPVLAEHGVTLTTRFYQNMFGAHPELKNIFNQAHQATKMQPKSLAAAVYAYACNIDNLAPLLPAVSLMAHKHVSLGVLPSQYPIVGENLLATLDALLTEAGFPRDTIDKVIAAWAVAYGQLANLLILEEEKLYKASEAAAGGWRFWRPFVLAKKEAEAHSGISSFYFKPVDGGAIPAYKPGQYTTVRVRVHGDKGEDFYQPRQYSLSQPSGVDSEHFRITVKREDAIEAEGAAPHPMPAGASAAGCPFLKARGGKPSPAGVVSNILHSLPVGSVVELAPPLGDFILEQPSNSPVVLLAAGVGITPLAPMLSTAVKEGRKVSFVYGCHNGAFQPLKSWFAETRSAASQGKLQSRVFFSDPLPDSDAKGGNFDEQGRIDVAKLSDASLLLGDASTLYYICGPQAFMLEAISALKARGVAAARIHAEMFGSGMVPV